MKTILPALSRLVLCLFCGLMTSCMMYDDGLNDPFYGGFDGGYSAPYGNDYVYDNRPIYYGGGHPGNFGGFSTGFNRGFGGGEFRDPYCNDAHVHSNNSNNSRTRGDDGKVDKDNLRIVGGNLRGKTLPENAHSADWYRSRGYDISKLKVEDEDGTRYKPSSNKSRSSPSGRSTARSSDQKSSSNRSSSSDRSSASRSSSDDRREKSSISNRVAVKAKDDNQKSSGGLSRKR